MHDNQNSQMANLTGDPKWDVFVIYMLGSIVFLFFCCIMLACMFIFAPADDRSGLNRTKTSRKRKDNVERRNTLLRINKEYETVVELIDSTPTKSKWIRTRSLL